MHVEDCEMRCWRAWKSGIGELDPSPLLLLLLLIRRARTPMMQLSRFVTSGRRQTKQTWALLIGAPNRAPSICSSICSSSTYNLRWLLCCSQ